MRFFPFLLALHLLAAPLPGVLPPDPLPTLPTKMLKRYDPVVGYTYARVTTPAAPLFATPEDGLAGRVKTAFGKGLNFVNLVNTVQAGGQTFYQIRSGEYIRAADVAMVEPSRFQGLAFADNPKYPFGWIVTPVRPSVLPGTAPPDDRGLLSRRKVVQIFAVQRVGAWNWYLVGPDEWVEQHALAKVSLALPPEGVRGKWIHVDLYEQTLSAYEGDRLKYATLISSGLSRSFTAPGVFQIYGRYETDRLRGGREPDGSDAYFLEAVPWVMYFDGSRGLHGAYWHDDFGFRRSHGCINLAPLDARWLFEWAEMGTSVWVDDPYSQTPTEVGGGAP